MKEKNLQDMFEKFLVKSNISYEREYPCSSGYIDFKMETNNKICGVEVKSFQGSLPSTIGQLILIQKTFSHVYLLAPEEFIEKIQYLTLENGLLNNIGLITLKEGNFVFLKEPSSKSYYFNPIEDRKKETSPKKTKNMMVCDLDLGIISTFQNRIFDYSSVIKEMKISRSNAHHRLKRLLRMGLIEEVSSFNPKQYRVKKVVEWGTKIPII
jgi:hypothetical protein